MRRTKIVCTIGPASWDEATLREMIREGMDVARINFSHVDDQAAAARIIALIRRVAGEEGKNVAILQDLQGPRIRVGVIEKGQVTLTPGAEFTLTNLPVPGSDQEVSIDYPELPRDVKPGNIILLADGRFELKVLSTGETAVRCLVVRGGSLGSHKGINVPEVTLSTPTLTSKDEADVVFGVEQGVDMIALSFVRRGADLLALKDLIARRGGNGLVIAKIEKHEAITNFGEILEMSDGVMVARGDLGIEMPLEKVPIYQKMIIQQATAVGKPVITATQMLESMIESPSPTRAEVSDVANAILDGTDATMLSGETASGKYPVEAVRVMVRIALSAEEIFPYQDWKAKTCQQRTCSATDAISEATAEVASDLRAAAIVSSTSSGYTARMVAKHRPRSPIIAVTSSQATRRQLAVSWGVLPVLGERPRSTDEMFANAVGLALKTGLVGQGDAIVITAGVPVGVPGHTNLLRVHVVGTVLVHGKGVGRGTVTGRVRLVEDPTSAVALEAGEIVVAERTDERYEPFLRRAAGVVTEEGGLTSHAALKAVEYGIPALIGVEEALRLLQAGMVITLDAQRGVIYEGQTALA